MRGILGQYIFAIPELNAVVVRLGHKRSDTQENGSRKDDFGRYRIYRRRNESPDKES